MRPFLENLQKNDVPCAVGCSAAAVLVEEALDALDLSQFFQVCVYHSPDTAVHADAFAQRGLILLESACLGAPTHNIPLASQRGAGSSVAPGIRTRWWLVFSTE